MASATNEPATKKVRVSMGTILNKAAQLNVRTEAEAVKFSEITEKMILPGRVKKPGTLSAR